MSKIITLSTLERYNNNIQQVIGDKFQKLITEHNHDERYYTKAEVDELLSNYVSLEYCTNNDILRLFDPSIPETPVEPEEPETPEYPETPEDPNQEVGRVYSTGEMIVKDKDLANGQYIFRYIDNNDNIIDNFNTIMTFDVDHSNENTDLPSDRVTDDIN